MDWTKCIATNWDGIQCENPIDENPTEPDDFFCVRHRMHRGQPDDPASKTIFERVEGGVKFTGSVVGLVGGIIKVAEFVASHWDKIQNSFPAGAKPLNVRSPTMEELKLERKAMRKAEKSTAKIRQQCDGLLIRDSLSAEELRALSVSVNEWFQSLPREVYEKTMRNFGSRYFEELRKLLAEGSTGE